MEKEFNLKQSRYELVRQLREDFGIHNSKAWSIMKRVEEQDKEFIRLLKKISCSVCEKEIDKLSGLNEEDKTNEEVNAREHGEIGNN